MYASIVILEVGDDVRLPPNVMARLEAAIGNRFETQNLIRMRNVWACYRHLVRQPERLPPDEVKVMVPSRSRVSRAEQKQFLEEAHDLRPSRVSSFLM